MELETAEDLLVEQLQSLYDAEHVDLELLPELTDAAGDPSVAHALEERHEATSEQRRRLEECFRRLGHTAVRGDCEALRGMTARTRRLLDGGADEEVRDGAVLAARRRVARYGVGAYAAARDLARRLGAHDVADLLEQTRAEEDAAAEELAQLGERLQVGAVRETA